MSTDDAWYAVHDGVNSDSRAYWQREREANELSLQSKAQDDAWRANVHDHARLRAAERAEAAEINRPGYTEEWLRGGEKLEALRAAEAEAARDRAERADPGTARLVEARDHQAAGGRFDDADSTQRLIDAETRRAAERAERRQVEDRETDAQLRHDRFPFWADRDRPEPGPTDRPGVYARTQPHQMQGRTRDRYHLDVTRYRAPSRDYPPATRRTPEEQR